MMSCSTSNFPQLHLEDSFESFAFLQVKAFGDLVIASAALRLLPAKETSRCRLVIGPYLIDLAKALAPGCDIEVLRTSDSTVPAAFDIKRTGLLRGVTSLLKLRAAVESATVASTVVLQSAGIRERFIVGRNLYREIPDAENVYLGFEEFIKLNFASRISNPPLSVIVPVRPSRVIICPFSRVKSKNLPQHVVIEIAKICLDSCFDVEILLLEGERFEHPGMPLRRVIPRRFDALSAALSDCAAVISADSLPAHLAEYCGTPTFVVSPIKNSYWFPKSVFLGDHWGVFSDKFITARLRRFLSTL